MRAVCLRPLDDGQQVAIRALQAIEPDKTRSRLARYFAVAGATYFPIPLGIYKRWFGNVFGCYRGMQLSRAMSF
jgi:hypothetical protein